MTFVPYRSPGSGVEAYEIGTILNDYGEEEEYIAIRFRSGGTYRYTTFAAGERIIRNLIEFARAGSGLNGYINREARFYYDWRD